MNKTLQNRPFVCNIRIVVLMADDKIVRSFKLIGFNLYYEQIIFT